MVRLGLHIALVQMHGHDGTELDRPIRLLASHGSVWFDAVSVYVLADRDLYQA